MHSCVTLCEHGSVQRYLTLVMWANKVLRDGGGGTKHDFRCLDVFPAASSAQIGDDKGYAGTIIGESNTSRDNRLQLLSPSSIQCDDSIHIGTPMPRPYASGSDNPSISSESCVELLTNRFTAVTCVTALSKDGQR